MTEQAIRYFTSQFQEKEVFVWNKYKGLDIEEVTLRLQKKYPVFCLLLFWHDNLLSKQQARILESWNSSWCYGPVELVRAAWAMKNNCFGPVWPIEGYTKEQYIELGDEHKTLKLHIHRLMMDRREWELQWSAPIEVNNGNAVVSYVMTYHKLLRFFKPVLDTVGFEWDEYESYMLWNYDDMATVSLDWRNKLLQPAKLSASQSTAYNCIKHYLKFNVFWYLEQIHPDFEIMFSKDNPQVKTIILRAMREERPLTPLELTEIEYLRNPKEVSREQAQSMIDKLRKTK